MKELKESIQKHAFNQNEMYAEIIQKANIHRQSSFPMKGHMIMKRTSFIGLALALVLAVSVWALYPKTPTMISPTIAAIVSVDINPSFELSTTEEGIVLEIEALNEDAESIETDDLINLGVDEVIDALILRATEAGFINLEDLEDDFIVVTTTSLEDDEEVGSELQRIIQAKIAESEGLESVTVVLMKASLREYFEARGKDIPMGLYVLNGMIDLGEEPMSIKDFFSDPDRKEMIKNTQQVTEVSQEKLQERIERSLSKLENAGEDVTALRERLENASEEEMLRIQSELRVNPKARIKDEESDLLDDETQSSEEDESSTKDNKSNANRDKGEGDEDEPKTNQGKNNNNRRP